MEQRPLRLGDLVDDYCPRERRVTNHAIVAIVNDAIRQTRCTTCDTEHVFKGAKAPRRRPAKPTLAAPPPETAEHVQAASAETTDEPLAEVAQPVTTDETAVEEPLAETQDGPSENGDGDHEREQDAWPANRQLIRATLPRAEGDQPPPRPIPEFTIYQRHNGRARGGFQFGRWSGNGNGNGHGDRRGGGPTGHPGGGGQGHGRRRHGKKRPR